MSDRSRSGNAYYYSSFRNNGRWAGSGINEDDYSEESLGYSFNRSVSPKFPHDNIKPEDLNGPCVIVQKGRNK